MTYNGPVPSPTEGFFEATKRGVFALHRCAHCRRWYWLASACRHCRNDPFPANRAGRRRAEWARYSASPFRGVPFIRRFPPLSCMD